MLHKGKGAHFQAVTLYHGGAGLKHALANIATHPSLAVHSNIPGMEVRKATAQGAYLQNFSWDGHAWVIIDSDLVHPSFSATAHAYSP